MCFQMFRPIIINLIWCPVVFRNFNHQIFTIQNSFIIDNVDIWIIPDFETQNLKVNEDLFDRCLDGITCSF